MNLGFGFGDQQGIGGDVPPITEFSYLIYADGNYISFADDSFFELAEA